MKPSTGRGNDIGGVPARRAWIPLKDRETVLMMHEVAVGCVNASKPVRFGLPKFFDHRKNQGSRFRKRTIAAERTGCDPTWVVLTCGSGGVTEMDLHRRGRTGAAIKGIPCEAY